MRLRFLTAGESHGPGLTAILEGMPAGLAIDRGHLAQMMARRRSGFGASNRMSLEHDQVSISAGVLAGRTTGAPIAMTIVNRDFESWSDRDIAPMTIPRPGHADLAAALKYGYGDLRVALERASARETAARTAVGALCAQLLAEFGITVGSYVVAIGDVEVELAGDDDLAALVSRADESDLRCPVPAAADRMRQAIRSAVEDGDTLGGVFVVSALGLPPGLGSHVHWDRRLTGRLLAAVGSIPAVKGVEIGPAFTNARMRGTAVHDRYQLSDGLVMRASNRGGGLEGGITTGEPLLVRAAMKPIATTSAPLPSIDLATGDAAETRYERSDTCAVPRAAVVGEAMVALVLADVLLEKLGGDSIDEMQPRYEALRAGHLTDLEMNGEAWQFGYEE